MGNRGLSLLANVVRSVMIWVACLALGALAVVGNASAALVVNSVTLNGGASVTVLPGATISVAVSETNTAGSIWRSTQIRTTETTTGTEVTTCINTPDHSGNGTYSETFNITAPATAGTYDVRVRAYENSDCSGSRGTLTLADGIIVATLAAPPSVLSINRSSFDPTEANTSVTWSVVFDKSVTGVDIADFALAQAGGVSGASLTSVTGSGTTWTVTANTGTGTTGTLRLDLVDNDTIVSSGLPLGGLGLGNGNFSGQSYTLALPYCATVPSAIYCDDFERTAPGVVGNGWTITPANVANCTSTDPANTNCAGIDRDIAPFNNYTVPHATNTRSMFTRWSIVSVDSQTIDLSTRPAALLSFWMRRGGDAFSEYPEAVGENYLVQYWDGAAWQILAQYPSGVMQGEVFTPVIQLPPGALHANFKLRFYQPSGSGKTGSGGAPGVVGYDYWHVDNVVVTEAPASSYVGAFCDNFEGGLGRWSLTAEGAPTGSSIGDARLGTTDFSSASHELDMRWGYVVASTLRTDMRGVGGNISYWVKSGGGTTNRAPDAGENLVAEYYNSSGSWTQLATYLANGSTTSSIYNASFLLPADAKHEGFRLRFRQLAGSGYDRDYWHVDDVCVGAGLPTADLSLSMTRGGALVPGANVPYTLTATNNGPGTLAGSLQIVNTLPADLSFFSASGTGWTCGVAGQTVTCSWVGTLVSGASAPALTLTATVALSASGTITNTATVTGTVTDNSLANNTASNTGSVDTATRVAEYHLDEASWNGTLGEVKDTAGYAGGPFDGSALASSSPLPTPTLTSPAISGSPGTCGYATMPGPAANGGAFTLSGLPVATTAGSKSSVAFWMYWDGVENVMPIGWSQHGLLFSGGSFGFTTNNSDIYGVSSAGLASGWHHVAAVFTNGSVTSNQLYIDGALQTLSQRLGSPNLANAMVGSTLQVGGWLQNSGYRFSGLMDEVLVYRNVLSPAEVVTIYGVTHPCPPMLNHIRIEHDGEGLTCTPEPVTVRACSNVNCTSEYTGSVTTTLSPSGWVGGNTITFSGGHTTAQLSYPTAGAITLGASSTTPIPSVAARCFNGATETCSMNFVNTGFIFSTTGASPFNQIIPTQTAGTSSGNLYLVAVRTDTTTKSCEAAVQGANSVDLAYECLNPATCYGANLMSINGGSGATTISRNNSGSVTSYASVNMTFDANGAAPFTMVYSDVGELRLHARKVVNGATLTGSGGGAGGNGGFVVKPAEFVLSAIEQTASPNLANPAAADAGGTKFVKAGEAFSVTVKAVTSTGSTAYSYGRETVAEGVKLTSALKPGLAGLINNPALVNSAAFGSFTNGVATGTTFSWDEVGIITLTPSVADGSYLGVGNITGTTTGDVGRFYAAKFALSAGAITNRADLCPNPPAVQPAGCPSVFTYIGESMNALFTLKAQAVGGATLQNYTHDSVTAANDFAKLDPMAAVIAGTGGPLVMGAVNSGAPRTPFPPCGGTPAHPCFTPSQATAGTFSVGVADIVVPFSIYRGNTPVGPYAAMEIGIAPQDSDGAILSAYDLDTVNVVAGTNNHAKVGSNTEVRFGRLKTANAYGSELLGLPTPLQAQYWNGTGWKVNLDDNATTLAAGSIIMSAYTGNLAAGETTLSPSGSVTFTAGRAPLGLTSPGAGNNGSVILTVDVPPWLRYNWGITANDTSPYIQAGCSNGVAPPNNDCPVFRATFGIYKTPIIYMRENY
ncbi:MAG: LamG-like jellyroll fold domain-containing protein [Sulfuricellaceae bacterium]|nr:LamG-like jellyroll fold domain-containing protein [Sulfuricellaceae bacterium]